MTTIKEALNRYYSDDSMAKHNLARHFKDDMDLAAKQDPRWQFFNYLLMLKTKGYYLYPEDCVDLCDSLNIKTVDDLFNWISYVKSEALMPILNPTINFNLEGTQTSTQISTMIKNKATLEPSCLWDFGDVNYQLVDKTELKQILDQCPIDHRKYIHEDFDCEDFARTTKCWLTLHEVGNIAFGSAEVNFYKDGKFVSAHGINIVPLRNGDVVTVEPQSDGIYPVEDGEFGFFKDAMKFRFIQF